MNKLLQNALILSMIMFIGSQSALACTNITLKAKDGTVMVGRTLEFGADLQSDILSSPRGKLFKTKTPDGKPGLSWHAKYGYLFADYFHQKHPVDGLNEKGLSFGYLYLPGDTQYSTIPKGEEGKAISYLNFPDWVLGNFSSVSDVKKALTSILVFAEPISASSYKSFIFPLHAIITDSKGKSIVVEFVKGKMRVYDDPLGVLTNSPTFDWQLTNLKNYVNLTPYAPAPIKVDGYNYGSTGQGSGMLGLPGDSTPPSRFVKMVFLTKTAVPVVSGMEALNLAQHIINNVDISKGRIRNRGAKSVPLETTQWTLFKDLKHQILYFKSYDNTTLQSVPMSEIDFSAGAKPFRIPMSGHQIMIDATKKNNLIVNINANIKKE